MKKILLFLFTIQTLIGFAQNPADVDMTFSGEFQSGNVNKIIAQTNGKILVCGNYDICNGVSNKSLTRLNSNGSTDNSLLTGTKFDGGVNAVILQSDSKIVAGGNFSNYGTVSRGRITRLLAGGGNDNNFNAGGVGFVGLVNTMLLQPDGKILVGGEFSSYDGANINGLIRINNTGSWDFTFINPGAGFNDNNTRINTIALQPDGKILVGGRFSSYNGVAKNKIIRLNTDGSIDNSFIATGPDLNSQIDAITLQADGKILVGGFFSTFNGVTQNGLVRLNANGSIDNTFTSKFSDPGGVRAIEIQGNKILIGGNFNAYDGITCKMVRLNMDGSIDNMFNIGTSFNAAVNTIVLQSDGKILVGGEFWSYNGIAANRIVRLNGTSILSTADFSKNKITLYPNPTKEILNFTLLETYTATSYEINNLLGEKVSYGNLNSNSISVSDLANGVYIIRVKTNEGVLISKFIKE